MVRMPSYAVVDTETTGFSPQADRVIEIGVVALRPDGSLEGVWETLLNPHRDLGAVHVHHIHPEDVLDAPDFADVAGDLADVLRGRCFVGHNVSFDARFIAAEYARAGLPTTLAAADCLCTMRLSGQLLPGPTKTLEACCAKTGVVNHDAHSALGDARATAELLRHLADLAGGFDALDERLGLGARAAHVTWPAVPAGHARTVQRPRH